MYGCIKWIEHLYISSWGFLVHLIEHPFSFDKCAAPAKLPTLHCPQLPTRRKSKPEDGLWSHFPSYQRNNESQFRDVHHKKCNNHRITLLIYGSYDHIIKEAETTEIVHEPVHQSENTLKDDYEWAREFCKLCSEIFWMHLSHNYVALLPCVFINA